MMAPTRLGISFPSLFVTLHLWTVENLNFTSGSSSPCDRDRGIER